MGEGGGLDDRVASTDFLFRSNVPPKDWKEATYGAGLPFGSLGALSSHGSSVLAVTRVLASADAQAVANIYHAQPTRVQLKFIVRVWLNDALVYDSAVPEKERIRPFPIRKGVNTMQVECKSAEHAPVTPGDVNLQFNDAKTGAPLNDLLFDISGAGK